ncbi:hypothetical protein KFE25_013289 [Diacronema lutheri]|uniref:Uncharacterized protein n=1 Tax=Diacronema lutheri TaxID=2081491 RepID=A0A8J5XG39_DIALT|nr:hypothetical protein KFE25_013289 [Diacronema lutheri]
MAATVFAAFRALDELCPPGAQPQASPTLQLAVERALRDLASALDTAPVLSPLQATVLLHQAAHVLALVAARAAGMGAASGNDEEGTRLALGVAARIARTVAAAAALTSRRAADGVHLRLTIGQLLSAALDACERARGASVQRAAVEAVEALCVLMAAHPPFAAFALPGVSSAIARLCATSAFRSSADVAGALRAWRAALAAALADELGDEARAGVADKADHAVARPRAGAAADALDALRARAAAMRGAPPGAEARAPADDDTALAAAAAGADAALREIGAPGACLAVRDRAWVGRTAASLAPLVGAALQAAGTRAVAARAEAVAFAAHALALVSAAADAEWAGRTRSQLARALVPSAPACVDALAAAAADDSRRVRSAARAALHGAASAGAGGVFGSGAGGLGGLLEDRMLAAIDALPDLARSIDEAAKLRAARALGSMLRALGGGGEGACAALATALPRAARALCAVLEPAAARSADARARGDAGSAYGTRLPGTAAQLDAAASRARAGQPQPRLAHARSAAAAAALLALPALVGAAGGRAALADLLLADARDRAAPPGRRLGAMASLAQLALGGRGAVRALEGAARWGSARTRARRGSRRAAAGEGESMGHGESGRVAGSGGGDAGGRESGAERGSEDESDGGVRAHLAAPSDESGDESDAMSEGTEDAEDEGEGVDADAASAALCERLVAQIVEMASDWDERPVPSHLRARVDALALRAPGVALLSGGTGPVLRVHPDALGAGLGLLERADGWHGASAAEAAAEAARVAACMRAHACDALRCCFRRLGTRSTRLSALRALPWLLEGLADAQPDVAHAAYAAVAQLAAANGAAAARARRAAGASTDADAVASTGAGASADANSAVPAVRAERQTSSGVSALLTEHLDVLIDSAARQLRAPRAHPRAPQLVSSILGFAPAGCWPLLADTVRSALTALGDMADGGDTADGAYDDAQRAVANDAPRSAYAVSVPPLNRSAPPSRALALLRVALAAAHALSAAGDAGGDGTARGCAAVASSAQPRAAPAAAPRPPQLVAHLRAAIAHGARALVGAGNGDADSCESDGDGDADGCESDGDGDADGAADCDVLAGGARAKDDDDDDDDDGLDPADGGAEPPADSRDGLLLAILASCRPWLSGARLAEALLALEAARVASAALGSRPRALLPAVHPLWLTIRHALRPAAEPRLRAASLRLVCAWLRSPAASYLRARASRELVPALLAALRARAEGESEGEGKGSGGAMMRAHVDALREAALDAVVGLEPLDGGQLLALHAHDLARAIVPLLMLAADDESGARARAGGELAHVVDALRALARAHSDAVWAALGGPAPEQPDGAFPRVRGWWAPPTAARAHMPSANARCAAPVRAASAAVAAAAKARAELLHELERPHRAAVGALLLAAASMPPPRADCALASASSGSRCDIAATTG